MDYADDKNVDLDQLWLKLYNARQQKFIMCAMCTNNLIDKYVLYDDQHIGKAIKLEVITFSVLFFIYDIIKEPQHRYEYALRNIREPKFELWVKRKDFYLLEEKEQESLKILYGNTRL